MGKKQKRLNTYFRQTAKAFKVARQTQIFSHINRNLPYTVYKFSKKQFNLQVGRLGASLYKRKKFPLKKTQPK